MGICMSKMTMEELVQRGIDRSKLCYITPGHDGKIMPRRITIGITSRLRNDKAKREDLLIQLSKVMRLDAFHFDIIGSGWDKVIPYLQNAGATVWYYRGSDDSVADYEVNIAHVPNFDYYLYLGFDEGSMGILDALAAGVPTIVTPQGFHLDIRNGITHSFEDLEKLRSIFNKIEHERGNRIRSVANLTWSVYAQRHAVVWRAMAANRENKISNLLYGETIDTMKLPNKFMGNGIAQSVPGFSLRTNLESALSDVSLFVQHYMGARTYHALIYIKRLLRKR